jgi:hypothetical protein
MRRESFEHFYLTKIALAEGCGCAEHVTRMRDLEDCCDRGSACSIASNFRFAAVAAWLGRLAKPVRRRRPYTVNSDPGTGW